MQTYTCPRCGAVVSLCVGRLLADYIPEMGPFPEEVTLRCQTCYVASGFSLGVGYFSVNIRTQVITFVHAPG